MYGIQSSNKFLYSSRMEKNIYVKYITFRREKVGKIYFFG